MRRNYVLSYEDAKEKLIVALDVPDREEALGAMAELSGKVGAFKIGLQLFTSAGPGFVSEAVNSGHRIFLDVKFHDIPNTVAKASVEATKLGVWMFNIHTSGGGEMMRAAADAVREECAGSGKAPPKLIGVTVLTSSNEETLRETGIEENVETRVLRLAQLAAKCGLDGVVASPAETLLIRNAVGSAGFEIVTPGIRSAGGTFDDQKRVMSPREAIAAGSDYLVIGRPIMSSPNRSEAARRILDEICEQEETGTGASTP
jgi:orotidine-5'-phosphate decarboxylase